MKKFILLILLVVPFNVSASFAVMDMDSKRILYENNMHEQKLIASTSKIMTAMVVIRNADLDKIIEVTPEVLKSFGSGIYIEVGEHISIRDLLYGLLLRSGNDAAIALAFEVGGSMEGFTLMMNELAQSIGMNNTKFINASGLEDNKGNGNISSSYDMALLMSFAMQDKTFREITKTKKHIVKTDYKTYEWHNKNKLLYQYKYTTGGKTGYTKKADRTLVTSASRDDRNVCIVTLDEEDDFNLHKNYYEKVFKKYKLVNIIDKDYFLKDEGLYVKDSFDMLLLDSEIDKVKIDVNMTDDVINRAGYVRILLDDIEYYRENIEHIKVKENLSFWDKVLKFFRLK